VIRWLAAIFAAGLLLSACGSQSMTAAMKAWASQGSGYSYVATNRQLITDATQAAKALRTKNETNDQLHLVCGVMDYDTEAANAFLPTPDKAASKLLNMAYGNLGAGATICYRASTNASKRTRALSYLSKGVGQLNEAYAIIESDMSTTPS
jgi:hypothetical protein